MSTQVTDWVSMATRMSANPEKGTVREKAASFIAAYSPERILSLPNVSWGWEHHYATTYNPETKFICFEKNPDVIKAMHLQGWAEIQLNVWENPATGDVLIHNTLEKAISDLSVGGDERLLAIGYGSCDAVFIDLNCTLGGAVHVGRGMAYFTNPSRDFIPCVISWSAHRNRDPESQRKVTRLEGTCEKQATVFAELIRDSYLGSVKFDLVDVSVQSSSTKHSKAKIVYAFGVLSVG